ncbi:SusC/RagA family TonB-linked outer membrane protein [Pinibacter aurantiacus]|uniref:TonB-dependent receptor n=1 Tax=Pinibacter aurantiacus TaxID=2851599 RepID=A0A9E2S9B6_9BACT|nr:TonB-dependent receptor [Pinibacter aurantiacus]MBV4357957.1 TonB-dependent receptor [Pinibacter aurantiacus]
MKKLLAILFAVCFCFMQVKAQQVVTGRVTNSATGGALPSVSVLIKGTSSGTQANENGEFSIKAGENAILIFNSIGYESQEIVVKGQSVINVKLKTASKDLNEVVVVGYGTQKKADITGSITQVKGEELVKSPTTSPMAALQGKVAGVQVVNNGAPGSAPTVRIRGVGSFQTAAPTSGNENRTGGVTTYGQPLYVVDGMLFDDISFLNNSDVAEMSLLKDASASAIYGVRAANGVVVITTKKGALNRPATFTFDTYLGFQKPVNVIKMANSQEYATMMKEMGSTNGLSILRNSIDKYGGDTTSLTPATNTDWFDQLLRSTAMVQSYNLGVNGGTSNAAYDFGGTYLKQDGILNVNNNYQRINMRGKVDFKVTDFLKMGFNFILSNTDQWIPNNNAMQSAFVNPSIYPVYDPNNPSQPYPQPFASPTQIGLSTYFGNPMAELVYKSNTREKITRIVPNIYADVNLLPKSKLVFRTAFNQDLSFGDLRKYTPQFMVGPGQQQPSSTLRKETNNYQNYVWDNTLTFKNSYDKHNYSVMLGNSYRNETYRYVMAQANNVPGDKEEYLYVHNGNSDTRINDDWGHKRRGLSYFGRLTYDYDGRYLLTATFRADGTSKYQDKWGYFPSIGLGWVATKEKFMESQKVFDFLKIRGSWGQLGNDKVPANDGMASVMYGQSNSGVFGNGIIPGYTVNSTFSYLGWEVVSETDLGFESRFLNNRLSFEFDYFHRMTNNAVFPNEVPNIGGTILWNNGKILNEGYEFSLGWSDAINKEFRYFVNGNLATLKNKVVKMQAPIYTGSSEFPQISRVGESVESFYGYQQAGVYQNTKEIADDPIAVANGLTPGDFKYVDQNKDGKINSDDRIVMGAYLPKLTYGFNLGFSYKAFDFSASFQGVSGNKIANLKRAVRRWQSTTNYDEAQVKNRWHGEGTSNLYPSAEGSVNPWNVSNFSTFNIESGSYFRIQNIQLGYTFDNRTIKSLKRGSARVYATAERPATFFKANAFTPEIANGVDQYVYPVSALYTFGIKLTY